MDFKEILAKVYRMRRTDKVLADPVVFAGRMYDLCKNEYETKKKIDLFYKLDTKVNFFVAIMDNDGMVEPLLAQYEEVAEIVSENSFRSLVMLVKEIVDKEGECYYPQGKQPPKPKQPKQAPQHHVQQQANNVQQPASQPTQQQPTYTSSSSDLVGVGIFWGIVIVVLGVIAGIVLGILGKRIEWWQWQYIIGAVGGAFLVGITIVIGCLLDCDSLGGAVAYIVAAIIISAVNIPLVFLYKEQYSIIFYWISAYLLVAAIIMAFYTFSDCEEGATVGCVIAALVVAVALSTYIGLHFTKFQTVVETEQPAIETIVEDEKVVEETEIVIEPKATEETEPAVETDISEEEAVAFDEQVQEETPEVETIRMVAGWAWWKWQHIIGAFGGLLLSAAFIIIAFLFMDEELYYWTPFTFGALLIVNIVLSFVYKSDYNVISYWVSGYTILTSAISSFMAFNDCEEGFGIASIVEILLAISLIIVVALLI